jgi:ABC-type glycerol-3-phosphate transport system substrate-binding protein
MAPNNFKNIFNLSTEAIDAMVEAVIVGDIAPKDALKDAQKAADKIIKEE